MNSKKLLLTFPILIAVLYLLTTGPGCATIVPPTGGPRDTLPPVLVNVNPRDSILNFKEKKVVFTFDEFVQIDRVQENLLVSPTLKNLPTVQSKLRTITINIRDTLDENTTYTFDFGNAVKDLNEGNIYRNFTYLVSTGSTIDSLQLGGKVIVAETGKVDSTLIVVLHTNPADSAVVKERPRYVARLNGQGSFMFRNLPADTFAIYAMKDEGGARRYQSRTQLFAFADSAVTSTSEREDLMLYAFVAEDTSAASKQPAAPPPPKKATPGSENILRLQTNLPGGQLDLLSNLELTFPDAPLAQFDSTGVAFTDETFANINGYSIRMDTSARKITLTYPWAENTAYNLLLDSSFATDTSGRRLLRNDTLSFRTRKASEYGLLRLRFLGLPLERNPMLQFIQGDNVKYSHVFTNNTFYARLFQPGEYELRLVFDENRNGKWDTGRFFDAKKQPEKVMVIQRKITVKANWDNEIDIQL